jgi:hypothetical protein
MSRPKTKPQRLSGKIVAADGSVLYRVHSAERVGGHQWRIIWRYDCADCGTPVLVETWLRGGGIGNRRCDRHKRPNVRVRSGKPPVEPVDPFS